MIHRFKLLLVAACLSLDLWGLKQTRVQASPVQLRLAASGSAQSSLISAQANTKANSKVNPPANQASATSASPVLASPTNPTDNPAPPPTSSAPESPASVQNASDTDSSQPNRISWVIVACLLTGGVLAVGRHAWQRHLSNPARQIELKAASLETDSEQKSTVASSDRPAIAPAVVQPDNLLNNQNQSSDASVSPLDDQISSDQSSIQSIEPINVIPTARLAKVDLVEALITDLHHSDAAKRRKAIWELGQRGDSRAIQPLVDLLIDADSQQRSLILAAIAEISTRTLKPINRALLISLQDESADVRKNAIRDITRIYDLMTQVSQLVQYAASDTDVEVQETARWALGQLNRLRSLPELTEPE